MEVEIRPYKDGDLPEMIGIWNEVVKDGIAFPQEDELTDRDAAGFFAQQTLTSVAIADGRIMGLYILHPNNVGRCGHIANASYAVSSSARGKGIGRQLVLDSLEQARDHGFRIMQFNAVVASNEGARNLYGKLGFTQLGVIPGGFRTSDGAYVDICPYYKEL